MRILLIEDDLPLGERLRSGMALRGFQVDWLRRADIARPGRRGDEYSAAVLDLGQSGQDGVDLLQLARRRIGSKRPVLALMARDALPERILGLDPEWDDFAVKPVDLNELAARLRALVHRAHGRATGRLGVRDVEIDPVTRSVWRGDAAVTLSRSEFDLLQVLMLNAGRVLSRQQLEQQLYAWGREVESNAIEVHIHHLRRKLGRALIQTVRGVGYKLPREG